MSFYFLKTYLSFFLQAGTFYSQSHSAFRQVQILNRRHDREVCAFHLDNAEKVWWTTLETSSVHLWRNRIGFIMSNYWIVVSMTPSNPPRVLDKYLAEKDFQQKTMILHSGVQDVITLISGRTKNKGVRATLQLLAEERFETHLRHSSHLDLSWEDGGGCNDPFCTRINFDVRAMAHNGTYSVCWLHSCVAPCGRQHQDRKHIHLVIYNIYDQELSLWCFPQGPLVDTLDSCRISHVWEDQMLTPAVSPNRDCCFEVMKGGRSKGILSLKISTVQEKGFRSPEYVRYDWRSQKFLIA